jgi:hypothetical protein
VTTLLFGGLTFTLLLIIAYVILIFVLVSLPVYLASKVIAPGKSDLLTAMAATFLSVMVFLLLAFLFELIFGPLGLIAGFLGVLLVITVVYDVGLMRGLALSILAFVFTLLLLFFMDLLDLLGIALIHILPF